jgi:hypothetical protein
MRKRLLLIAVVAFFSYNFFLPQISPKQQDVPLKVNQFGSDFLNISWNIQNLEVTQTVSNGILFSYFRVLRFLLNHFC